MSFTSYAQNFEDIILWRALHDAEPKTYLDIGAQDPLIDSVSFAFYQAGWRGTHVEPTPTYASRLRAARPDEVVIEAAISQSPGLLELYEVPNTGLSTGRPEIAQRHADQGYELRSILVPTLRLDVLLERTGEVAWMKIDVEGMEADVLGSWGDNAVRPWVLIVEATLPNTQQPSHHEWRDMVLSRGYREVYWDGLSRYFVHDSHGELADRFSCPPNIFDGFQITADHFSTAVLSQTHDELEEQIEALGERLRATESELGATQLSHLQSQARANELAEEVANAQRLLEAAERNGEAAIEQLQKEHRDSVRLLRDHASGVEQTLRQAISAFEEQLSDTRTEITKLRDREAGHLRRMDALIRDRKKTEGQLEKRLVAANHLIDQAASERAAMEGRVSELGLRLELADDLIRKALAEPTGLWQRLGRAVGIAGEDRARRALRSWEAHNPHSNGPPVEPTMSIPPLPATGEYLQADSLAELLSLNDREFIRATYATILGREADEGGEAFYVDRLGRGVPKIQIIDEISRSPEARLFPDPLPELKAHLRRFRLTAIYLGKQKAGTSLESDIVARANRPNVREFMRYHDEQFVHVIFRYYLGRDPDPQGLEHYITLLRRGVSRQQVLIEVSNSEEASRLGRWSFGQRRLAAILRLERTPVLGHLFAAVRFNLLIRQHLRDMRAMQNHLYRLTQKLS